VYVRAGTQATNNIKTHLVLTSTNGTRMDSI
jgi:hypothetical protein